MTDKLEKQFFDTFGIEPTYKDYRTKNGKTYESKNPQNRNIRLCYPQITDRILLELEEIFSHKEINGTGFFDGFHIKKHNDYWLYQLTYYKGGYYTCGFGKTRKEAFLDQLITILNDKQVEEKEKQLVKQQVQALFKEQSNDR
jgi:hypothetical protein